jgi:four helix bundle protein
VAAGDSTFAGHLQAHIIFPGHRAIWAHQPTPQSISIRASNISEDYGKSTRGEYVLFLGHARGCIFEVQTQLTIAAGLGFGTAPERQRAEQLSHEVSRMIVAMMKKLKR